MSNTIVAKNGRGVKGLARMRRAARLADTLYYDTEIAKVQGRCLAKMSPTGYNWLEAQVAEHCIGFFPSEKLAVWEKVEAELGDEEIWAWYEAQARRQLSGGDGADAVPVCVLGEMSA